MYCLNIVTDHITKDSKVVVVAPVHALLVHFFVSENKSATVNTDKETVSQGYKARSQLKHQGFWTSNLEWLDHSTSLPSKTPALLKSFSNLSVTAADDACFASSQDAFAAATPSESGFGKPEVRSDSRATSGAGTSSSFFAEALEIPSSREEIIKLRRERRRQRRAMNRKMAGPSPHGSRDAGEQTSKSGWEVSPQEGLTSAVEGPWHTGDAPKLGGLLQRIQEGEPVTAVLEGEDPFDQLSLIQQLGRAGFPEASLELLRWAKEHRQRRFKKASQYTALITALGRSGQGEQAAEIFTEMQSRGGGVAPTYFSYSALILARQHAGQWEEACQVLLQMRKAMRSEGPEWSPVDSPANAPYNAVISACAQQGQRERAAEVFATMKVDGVAPDVITFSSLINAYSHGGRWEEAFTTFSELMQTPGVSPNAYTFTTLITACRRGRQYERALEVFETSRALGVAPNTYTYNALIEVCGVAGWWERALEAFVEMHEAGVEQDTRTYNSAIRACGKGAQYERAEMLFDAMPDAGVTRNTITYDAMIGACERQGKWERAVELLGQMKAEGVPADVRVYSTAVSACARAFQWDAAFGILELMQGDGVSPNVVTFTILINACRSAPKRSTLQGVVLEMQQMGLAPNTRTYNALMRAEYKARDCDEGFKLFERMRLEGVPRDAFTYRAQMAGCITNARWPQLFEVFAAMTHDGIEGHPGDWEEALHLLVAAECAEVDPVAPAGARDYTKLIRQCARRGHWQRALVLYRQLRMAAWEGGQEGRCGVGREALDEVAGALWRCGEHKHALQVMHEAVGEGVYQHASISGGEQDVRAMTAAAGEARTLCWLIQLEHGMLHEFTEPAPCMRLLTGPLVKPEDPLEIWEDEHGEEPLLQRLQSPFREVGESPGTLEASGEEVREWLNATWKQSGGQGVCEVALRMIKSG
ncbi:hypothetical protein CYMTET_52988 [Cymbomonas tetramitiformis]|uniref:PROP1-like PPR domain-containing protein n=1 Tax=Cymbomonas tetramitiformis TaxID=36881 RepID=A0AAE0BJA1_9CHLO|nr:hypothetical protein CYMTET_52988 [Cymbomonas tetramitiformis]